METFLLVILALAAWLLLDLVLFVALLWLRKGRRIRGARVLALGDREQPR